MIRAYCDESYDGKSRIYTIAGFVARDKEWATVAKRWKIRCLQDGIQCYHAADCEGGFGDFKPLSKDKILALNTDLIGEMLAARLVGFATSIILEDYRDVAESSERAKRYLGPSPYFMAMQVFLVSLSAAIHKNRPNYRVAFIFDQQKEFSGRARAFYHEIKLKNPNVARCMGSLTYEDKCEYVPLQIADKLAYESMKNMLNLRYEPLRPERVALSRMKSGGIIQTLNYVDGPMLDRIVRVQP